MQKEITLKAPAWVAEDEVLSLLYHDLQMKLAYYESQCRVFEQKYGLDFPQFEAQIRNQEKEDFQKWEDLMDWETADSARQEMKERLQELSAWKT